MPSLPEPVPPEVTRLAEQHQLGLLIDGFITNRKQGVWKQKDAGNRVYAYEPGLVRILEGQPLEALRWEWFNRVDQQIVHHHTNSAYNATNFSYTLYRPDGGWSRFSGSYHDPSKRLRADPYDNDNRYATFLRDGTAGVWRQQIRESLLSLERNEVLSFGEFSLDRAGLHTPKGLLAWHEISDMSLDRAHVVVEKRGKLLPFALVPVSKVAHYALLATLVSHLRTS